MPEINRKLFYEEAHKPSFNVVKREFNSRHSRVRETRAGVKITPREKRRHAKNGGLFVVYHYNILHVCFKAVARGLDNVSNNRL